MIDELERSSSSLGGIQTEGPEDDWGVGENTSGLELAILRSAKVEGGFWFFGTRRNWRGRRDNDI